MLVILDHQSLSVLPVVPSKCMVMGKSLGSQVVYGVTPLSLAVDGWISGGPCDMKRHYFWKYQGYEAFS